MGAFRTDLHVDPGLALIEQHKVGVHVFSTVSRLCVLDFLSIRIVDLGKNDNVNSNQLYILDFVLLKSKL